MKILGRDSEDQRFNIADEDRIWVEENFRWLKEVFGYPNRMEEQIEITPHFFPHTFSEPAVKVDNVVADLCRLFSIVPDHVTTEIRIDLRDYNNIPHQVEGIQFECETDLRPGAYRIFVAGNLQKHPRRMIYSLIYEFIRIRLTESDLEFDVGGDDTGLFIYLAGIYYGFGVVLADHLIHPDKSGDVQWTIKWEHGVTMPLPVMAFSLATYADLTGTEDPIWKNQLNGEFRKLFELAMLYVQEHPSDLYDENEVKANDLFNLANVQFENNELDDAIATLQKILFITSDDVMRADVYNNMGYYYMRRKDYTQGISNFRKALALGPEYGYANDNLGYALILTGELEEGKTYIDKAITTGNNDVAYTYRNLALYYQFRKEYSTAEEWFQKSFHENVTVDLLEYHYAEFLLEQEKLEDAMTYFQKSAGKNEQEGLHRINELSSQRG